ncbi:MAG: hypothetical protein SFV15_13105 [Polyangiaceae bacterium]|nr:hypothetical protein [Polyangiaceae bacterium]
MRSLLFLSLVCWGTASCSGGPGLEVYNGSDQTTPPTDPQQSPVNATQQAALDPQTRPPLDAQSVAPVGDALGSTAKGGIPRLCNDWCQKSLMCESKAEPDCFTECVAELVNPNACTASLTALVSCLLASPDFNCSLKEKDVPAACSTQLATYLACSLTLDNPGPLEMPGQGNGGGMQGMAGASGRL